MMVVVTIYINGFRVILFTVLSYKLPNKEIQLFFRF